MTSQSQLELTPEMLAAVPPHVPRDRIAAFSTFDDPDFAKDPFRAVTKAHAGPDVIWSPLSRRAARAVAQGAAAARLLRLRSLLRLLWQLLLHSLLKQHALCDCGCHRLRSCCGAACAGALGHLLLQQVQ